jgi:hypothetical protein
MGDVTPWALEGDYLESCNCEAICPCRMIGGVPGGRSTYGECFGLLAWKIRSGRAGAVDLSGLAVALACRYHDDEAGSPWSIVLYLDERADAKQREALKLIYLGRAGGERVLRLPWVRKPSLLLDIRASAIDFEPGLVRVGERATIRASRPVDDDRTVTCLIPGHEESGNELIADELAVRDAPFDYVLTGNCAYRSEFHYGG